MVGGGVHRSSPAIRSAITFDPDEQVPKYSKTVEQVPYNQHLGPCVFQVGRGPN